MVPGFFFFLACCSVRPAGPLQRYFVKKNKYVSSTHGEPVPKALPRLFFLLSLSIAISCTFLFQPLGDQSFKLVHTFPLFAGVSRRALLQHSSKVGPLFHNMSCQFFLRTLRRPHSNVWWPTIFMSWTANAPLLVVPLHRLLSPSPSSLALLSWTASWPILSFYVVWFFILFERKIVWDSSFQTFAATKNRRLHENQAIPLQTWKPKK